MSSDPKYMNADIANKFIEMAETNSAYDAKPVKTRSDKDPMGLKEPPPVGYEVSQEAAERLVNFWRLLVAERRLDANQAIYLIELTALNILNADDIPLSPEALKSVRQDAYEYYVKSRPIARDAVVKSKRSRGDEPR